jgi:deoxyribonuclease IV
MFFFGAHMPSKNIIESLEEVKALGGNMIQIFVANPMSARHRDRAIRKYSEIGPKIKEFIHKNKMSLVIHSPYVLNFANRVVNPSEAYWVKSYMDELMIADLIGAIGCVIHVGKHLNTGVDTGLQYMYVSLKYLIHKVIELKLEAKIILETAAGQGTELLVTHDNSFIDLLTFYKRFSERERDVLKICIDTAHVFSAGYDIRNDKLLHKLFETFSNDIALIHLNDSKKDFNSHLDRHERIGKGTIGKETLMKVVMYAQHHKIPLILETPDSGYLKEIPWIKSILVRL